ncbi:MAG TPA: M36 family metallopeptidase, partial [Kofleriaceae bacterium]|nr:M36 family metallopeptidase [Kofleriaceae bacterium]
DFWYDAGFTEAAGNAQDRNFNRGGEDRDAILAEAEDNANDGSRNNANMATPADGFPPRMQVFVRDGRDDRSLAISGRKPATAAAAFGARNFEVTAPVILADDGVTTGGSTRSDACSPLVAPATGMIVLADRGLCTAKVKALHIESAGGVAMILAHNVAAVPAPMPDDVNITAPVAIGSLSVSRSEGDAIKADLAAGPVTAQIHRALAGDLDGTLDFTVIAHEFAHYLHHRLQSCNTPLCGAQSEGWGDFNALLTMVQPGDNLDGAYAAGVYSTQSFAADPMYFGIRRAPYSTSLDINPLTFKHMGIDNRLPLGTAAHPFNGSANPFEAHNAGEVWASMLWQGYAALLEQPGADFAATRRRMQQYVVAGLLMSPVDATPTETRDALLAAAHAASPADHDVLAAAYARRGFGTCAVSPPRTSALFAGIVESYEVQGRFAAGAATVQPVASCDDDDVLDGGESLQITVPVANTGAAELRDVAISLTAGAPGVHIEQATVAVGTLAAYASTTASFTVALDEGVSTRMPGDFHIELAASNGCNPSLEVPLSLRLNTDDVPDSSATDTFDTGDSVWTTTGDARWSHDRRSALDGFWAGSDAGTVSDASLVSPALTAGDGPLAISFSHRFAFERAGATGFDGGVVEISTDDGASWADVSVFADPGYNATLAGSADIAGNPLAGRRAYGRINFAYPNPETVMLRFGTALAGKTFRLRFRIGSDNMNGDAGWEIDNVAFTGIVGMPFPTLVPDAGHCLAGPEPGPGAGSGDPGNHDGDGGCAAGAGADRGAGAVLGLGLFAVLLRRRRR